MQLTVTEEKPARRKRLNVVSVKMVRERILPYVTNIIRNPQDIFSLAKEMQLPDEDREHCLVIALSTKNHVVAIHTVSIGTLNSACVHPREVLKVCILASAASYVLVHNHPSNDPTFSQEDISLSQRLVEASQLVGIEMLDHVVVTSDSFRSMKEQGII